MEGIVPQQKTFNDKEQRLPQVQGNFQAPQQTPQNVEFQQCSYKFYWG